MEMCFVATTNSFKMLQASDKDRCCNAKSGVLKPCVSFVRSRFTLSGFCYMIYSKCTDTPVESSFVSGPRSMMRQLPLPLFYLFLSNQLLDPLLHILDVVRPSLDRANDLAHDGTVCSLGLLEPSNCLVDDPVQFGLR